jgi:hypothetical protein
MLRDKTKRRIGMTAHIGYSWGLRQTSGYDAMVDLLWSRIPRCGEVPDAKGSNKKLERFRMADKLVYDLFNNGLCNRRSQFMSFFKSKLPMLGKVPQYSRFRRADWERLSTRLGWVMQDIILDALKEQYPELYYSSFDSKIMSKRCKSIVTRGQHKVKDVPDDELVMRYQ